MTSLAQVTALVDAHAHRDPARFRAVTLQIAAHVAGRSERGADHLRKLVDRQQQQAISLVPLPSASGLFSVRHDLAALDDMVLTPRIRDQLDRVVLEHARREDLLAAGLRPASKLLFAGSPGTGKGMAAGAIARAVGLPMFRVELHGVISQFLGETASKLAKVFEHVSSMPAVYLFDEFDALGTDRSTLGNEAAGAEMRRVVNSLLQFIEDDRSESLIVAATNHAQMLDSAIFRRFDEMIRFEPLTQTELTVLTERALGYLGAIQLDYGAIYAASPKLGHADLCAVLDRARKDHVLSETPIDTQCLVDGILRRMRVEVSV
jgi:SpoVK/Ycf46/Vps4 family AAA+-type ATPase